MTRLSSAGKIAVSRSSAEDRAQSVLFKAADLFYRQGYDATSMNDIAQAVELTKAGLYYYTKGKEDWLYKIMDFAMDCVERDIVEPAEEISAEPSIGTAIVCGLLFLAFGATFTWCGLSGLGSHWFLVAAVCLSGASLYAWRIRKQIKASNER